MAEAIPSAFGLFAAYDGDALGSIIGAVNVGYDTDTIATMSGALSGALRGAKAFPEHFLPTLEKANQLEIEKLAQDLTRIAQGRKDRREYDESKNIRMFVGRRCRRCHGGGDRDKINQTD